MEHDFYLAPYSYLTKQYPNCYVAAWSAAAYWKFIDELSNTFILFSKDIDKKTTFDKTDIIIHHIPEDFFFDTIQEEDYEDSFSISSPTKTIIDCFAYPELSGGHRQLQSILEAYKQSAHYNPALLMHYAKQCLTKTQSAQLFQWIKGENA